MDLPPPQPELYTATSTSLLEGLREPDNAPLWAAFVDRYRPLVVRTAQRAGVPESEAEDVAQAALLEFARAYRAGEYERARGRLRHWLFGIVRHQVGRWRRARRSRELQPESETRERELLAERESPDGLAEIWKAEWRRAVLRQCLLAVRPGVEERTWLAFERFALAGRPAEEVAQEFDMTLNAVYGARRRVVERVRELLPRIEEHW